jgi:hypothetical protein
METKKTKMTNRDVLNEYRKIMGMIDVAIKEEEEENELEKYKKSIRPALKQLKAMQEIFVEEMDYTEEEAKEMIKSLIVESIKKNI